MPRCNLAKDIIPSSPPLTSDPIWAHTQSNVAKSHLVNINTASVEELEELPGIGPILAGEIVRHRQLHGPFQRPEEILAVRKIGEKKYKQLAPLIRTQ